ncbi:hypothetical protein [Yersinia intermedia]|nr:hypothetical protein [Yersinia intermedia]
MRILIGGVQAWLTSRRQINGYRYQQEEEQAGVADQVSIERYLLRLNR